VTPRARQLLLLVIGAAWLLLGAANFAKGHTPTGVLYVVLGVVCGAIALSIRTGRRSR
jgi:hypothetical protein